MASLKVKIGADTSLLGKGIRRAKGMIGGLGKVAKAAGLAGGAAAIAGLAVSIRGLNSALKEGSRLSDVAANTGMLAGQVAILERAFRDAGVSGEKVQGTITKMQRSLVEGGEGVITYQRAFKALKLSLNDLRAMSPGQQFNEIQRALAGLSDPAERSARAMQIFGRSGAELSALFSNEGALSSAAASLGMQADILNKNSDSFDRSADLLAGVGEKLRGFFLGMADFITPVLLPVLESLNKIDLAAYGQAAGRFIAVIAEGFSQGALGGMFADLMVIGAKEWFNTMWKGIKGIASFLGSAVLSIFEAAASKIMDMGFWLGVADVYKSIGLSLVAAGMKLSALLSFGPARKALLDAAGVFSDRSKDVLARAVGRQTAAGNGKGISDILSSAMGSGLKAYAEQQEGEGVLSSKIEAERLAASINRLRDAVDKKNDLEEKAAKGNKKPPMKILSPAARIQSNVAPRINSLAKVGGAAMRARSESLAKERNSLLRSIDRKIGRAPVARFA